MTSNPDDTHCAGPAVPGASFISHEEQVWVQTCLRALEKKKQQPTIRSGTIRALRDIKFRQV